MNAEFLPGFVELHLHQAALTGQHQRSMHVEGLDVSGGISALLRERSARHLQHDRPGHEHCALHYMIAKPAWCVDRERSLKEWRGRRQARYTQRIARPRRR